MLECHLVPEEGSLPLSRSFLHFSLLHLLHFSLLLLLHVEVLRLFLLLPLREEEELFSLL